MLYEVYKNFWYNELSVTVITETGYVTQYNVWVITLGDIFLIVLAHGYLLYFLLHATPKD
jgi:hypothetical protein